MKFVVQECDKSITSRKGGFDLVLPFGCWLNVAMRDETTNSKLKKSFLQFTSPFLVYG